MAGENGGGGDMADGNARGDVQEPNWSKVRSYKKKKRKLLKKIAK